MELEQQLATIIKDAPNYGVPAVVVEQAIAPALKLFAAQLQQTEYFILQNIQSEWVLTTIANPKISESKQIVYAFVSVKDAATFQGKGNPELMAMPIPIIELLFRLFSLQELDSIIFLEDSYNLNRGQEIQRTHLTDVIIAQLKQLQNPPNIV